MSRFLPEERAQILESAEHARNREQSREPIANFQKSQPGGELQKRLEAKSKVEVVRRGLLPLEESTDRQTLRAQDQDAARLVLRTVLPRAVAGWDHGLRCPEESERVAVVLRCLRLESLGNPISGPGAVPLATQPRARVQRTRGAPGHCTTPLHATPGPVRSRGDYFNSALE